MVAAGTGGKARKSTLRNATARLLVLGDKQVGKSAAIVRFTTGRFIQSYSPATGDWLYKQPLGFDNARNYFRDVELLEQRDVASFQNSSMISATDFSDGLDSATDAEDNNSRSEERRCASTRNPLSCRVARDRQLDAELHERQQLLEKLRWANAFVVVYALNSSQSFNKAIRYLNLIANEVNNNQQVNSSGSSNGVSARRPILLLANKLDLDQQTAAGAGGRTARRVCQSDGRLLAMRHQCLFAELSVCESARPIEQALTSLIEAIPTSELHLTNHLINHHSAELGPKTTQLIQWQRPADFHQRAPLQHILSNQQQQPIWSSLVRTRAPQLAHSVSSIKQQQQILQTGCLASKAVKRLMPSQTIELQPAAWRAQTPVGARLSSSSSTGSSASSSSCGSTLVASSPLVLAQAQTTRPLALARTSISSTSSISSAGGASGQVASNKSQLGARYESLKSSFKKASLAIVGSRSLAARVASKPTAAQLARDSQSSLRIAEECGAPAANDSIAEGAIAYPRHSSVFGSTSNLGQRPAWMRLGKLGLTGKQEAAANSIDNQSLAGELQTTSRFKRPLFKYRNRRKTVAFDAAAAPTNGASNLPVQVNKMPVADSASLSQASASSGTCCSMTTASNGDLTPQNKLTVGSPPLAECRNHSYNALCRVPIEPSGGGGAAVSSSALSVATPTNSVDTSWPSQPATTSDASLQNELSSSACSEHWPASSGQLSSPATIGNTSTRRDSRSTLSRTSTSGGSCDDDSELSNGQTGQERASSARPDAAGASNKQRAARSILTIETIRPLLEEASVSRVYQAYCKRLVAW